MSSCPACGGSGDLVSDAFMWAPCSTCGGAGRIRADEPADLELRAAYSSTVRAHVAAAHDRDRLWWAAWCLMWAAIGAHELTASIAWRLGERRQR